MLRRFPLLWVLAATAAIAGAALGGPWLWLHYAGKPLATLSILWLAASAQPFVTARYRHAVLAGMSLSLVGDVCLMLPGDHFVAGLIAFLLAHVCYIVAFAPGSSAKARAGGLILIAAVALVNLAGLLPRIDADLKVPVIAYVAVLATMAGVALRVHGRQRSRMRCRAAYVLQRRVRCASSPATACWRGIASPPISRCPRFWYWARTTSRSGALRSRYCGADPYRLPDSRW